jgi:hypothetical protein
MAMDLDSWRDICARGVLDGVPDGLSSGAAEYLRRKICHAMELAADCERDECASLFEHGSLFVRGTVWLLVEKQQIVYAEAIRNRLNKEEPRPASGDDRLPPAEKP